MWHCSYCLGFLPAAVRVCPPTLPSCPSDHSPTALSLVPFGSYTVMRSFVIHRHALLVIHRHVCAVGVRALLHRPGSLNTNPSLGASDIAVFSSPHSSPADGDASTPGAASAFPPIRGVDGVSPEGATGNSRLSPENLWPEEQELVVDDEVGTKLDFGGDEVSAEEMAKVTSVDELDKLDGEAAEADVDPKVAAHIKKETLRAIPGENEEELSLTDSGADNDAEAAAK